MKINETPTKISWYTHCRRAIQVWYILVVEPGAGIKYWYWRNPLSISSLTGLRWWCTCGVVPHRAYASTFFQWNVQLIFLSLRGVVAERQIGYLVTPGLTYGFGDLFLPRGTPQDVFLFGHFFFGLMLNTSPHRSCNQCIRLQRPFVRWLLVLLSTLI